MPSPPPLSCYWRRILTRLPIADIKSNFALLDRAVALFDARFSLRALRSISIIRKRSRSGKPGHYWYRLHVPAALRPLLGWEVKKSLGTDDLEERASAP